MPTPRARSRRRPHTPPLQLTAWVSLCVSACAGAPVEEVSPPLPLSVGELKVGASRQEPTTPCAPSSAPEQPVPPPPRALPPLPQPTRLPPDLLGPLRPYLDPDPADPDPRSARAARPLAVRFRYISDRVGESEVIKEYCVDEALRALEDRWFDTPPSSLAGRCAEGLACASASAHRSGPVEPAYFWAAANLAMSRHMRSASAGRGYQEEDEQGQLALYGSVTDRVSRQETRFQLDAETSCFYRVKLFEDRVTYGRDDLDRITKSVKMSVDTSSQSLWMERVVTPEGGERLLMIAEQSSEAYGEAILLERSLLCERSRGELSALGASGVRFWTREEGSDWVVEAAPARE